ncbi:MAG: HD domain-containing protein, partial [Steroidobacteraceae bacterium]|nr:HD domain-containing protein [Steroidobacteraceae bacterium]MDW8260257.1 HD domain-containing protein [Gammaproteobacteria bacterium]
ALFMHAIRGLCLAGALSLQQAADDYRVRLALLGGLLHDIGEIYIHPQYLVSSERPDTPTFRQIAIHPRVGRLLLEELTDYPPELGVAIDEHHERLDGSGYPARKTAAHLSELGRLLAVVEAVLGTATEDAEAPLPRALLALRFVSGEFDPHWTSAVTAAAATASALDGRPASQASAPPAELVARLAAIEERLAAAHAEAIARSRDPPTSPSAIVAQDVLQRLTRLRAAWAQTGLTTSGTGPRALAAESSSELLAREMCYRLVALQKEIALRCATLSDEEAARLQPLRDALEI